MIVNFTQRWTQERKAVYHPLREYFNRRNFEIATISEAAAKEFIKHYHYSKSIPVTRRRFGLFECGKLVGVAVYSHPMSEKVITNVFNCKKAADGLELGRLCLTDEVLSNAESYFVGECHRRLKKEGFVGVISFSDGLPRTNIAGDQTHVGHLGTVYQALNAAFLKRGTPSKLYLLPDGTVFSNRTISKIRAGESGWEYGARILEVCGAAECPVESEPRKEWLKLWLERLTRRLHHPGNLKYGWSFSRKIVLKGFSYPKIRYGDLQPGLNFGNF